MLSSHGTGIPPSWRRRETSTVTGPASPDSAFADESIAACSTGRSAGMTSSSSGLPSTSPWSCPSMRVMAAETDTTLPDRVEEDEDRRRVVHQGPEPLGLVGQDLPTGGGR